MREAYKAHNLHNLNTIKITIHIIPWWWQWDPLRWWCIQVKWWRRPDPWCIKTLIQWCIWNMKIRPYSIKNLSSNLTSQIMRQLRAQSQKSRTISSEMPHQESMPINSLKSLNKSLPEMSMAVNMAMNTVTTVKKDTGKKVMSKKHLKKRQRSRLKSLKRQLGMPQYKMIWRSFKTRSRPSTWMISVAKIPQREEWSHHLRLTRRKLKLCLNRMKSV